MSDRDAAGVTRLLEELAREFTAVFVLWGADAEERVVFDHRRLRVALAKDREATSDGGCRQPFDDFGAPVLMRCARILAAAP